MIKTAIRFGDNKVMVFNEKGEQLSRYQGEYEKVKDKILKATPDDAIFQHCNHGVNFEVVEREKW